MMRLTRFLVYLFLAVLLLAPISIASENEKVAPPMRFRMGFGSSAREQQETTTQAHGMITQAQLALFASYLKNKNISATERAARFEQELKGKLIQVEGIVSPVNVYPHFRMEIHQNGISPFNVSYELQNAEHYRVTDLSSGTRVLVKGMLSSYSFDDDTELVFHFSEWQIL